MVVVKIVVPNQVFGTKPRHREANRRLDTTEKLPGSVRIRYDLFGTYVRGRL